MGWIITIYILIGLLYAGCCIISAYDTEICETGRTPEGRAFACRLLLLTPIWPIPLTWLILRALITITTDAFPPESARNRK